MIRDITLGQYYPGESWVHKLDPRVKIIATLLFIVNDFIGFAISAVVLAVLIAVSGVPLSFILRGLKPILIILLFTFALNIFMISGEVIWSWWILKITKEGIRTAVFMAIRLILLIIGSSMTAQPDRRNRKAAFSVQGNRAPGARNRHDDDNRAQIHTDAAGRNR